MNLRKRVMIMGMNRNMGLRVRITTEILKISLMLGRINSTHLRINSLTITKVEGEVEVEIIKVKETIKESIMRQIPNVKLNI